MLMFKGAILFKDTEGDIIGGKFIIDSLKS